MGIFDDVPSGKVFADGNYLRAGQYFLRIDRLKVTENFKKEAFFAIECTVLAVLDDADGTGHKAGEEVTHLLKRSSTYFASDVKKFVMAILGVPEDEITAAALEALCAEDQPMQGTFIEVRNTDKMTKGDPSQGKQPIQITVIGYKREVPAAEVLEAMDEDDIARLFESEWIEKKLAQEEAA